MVRIKKLLIIILLGMFLTSCSIEVVNQPVTEGSLQDVKAEFHFLSVGQGDSTLVKLGDYIVLVDAGPDSAEQYITNYITELGIDTIDLLIVTHPHDDHIGAVDGVLKSFKVKKIIDSGYYHPNKHYESYESAIAKEVLLGAKYGEDEDLKIEVNDNMFIEIFENGDDWQEVNNQSVVSKITCGEVELLLTGDLEKAGEKALLKKSVSLNADIFAAGHHGSVTANTKEFVEVVSPKYAIISAGYENKYGLPHEEVSSLFSKNNITALETAYCGTIVLKTDGKVIKRDNLNANYQLQITKVDKINEIVTIKNNSDSAIDLTNWYLISARGNQVYNFPKGYTLKAGLEVNITSGKNAYEDGKASLKWTTKNIWSNSKPDNAYLYNADNKMITMKN